MRGDRRPRRPVPRSRSGMIGRRWERTGTEPIKAQSPLELRLLLSVIFTPVFAAGTALFAVWAAHASAHSSPTRGSLVTITAVCAALALFALLDLVVILRRRRRERGTGG